MKNTYCNDQYLHYLFASCISPVAKGVKPSGLLTVWKYRIPAIKLKSYLDEHKSDMPEGCFFKILKETALYYLVIFYHDSLLRERLYEYRTAELLKGYPVKGSVSQMINHLRTRIENSSYELKDFPHEVGIFLGYPIWDVEGFIKHRGMDYKLCGYWKVYQDAEGAKAKFNEYDRIRASALAQYYALNERNNYIK